jgi:Tfp pilus assembly protein PilW
MEFKITCIEKKPRRGGWTLVETMVALGIFSIAGLVMGSLFLSTLKAYASLSNYSLLDQCNRQNMDRFTQEIRQAKQVTGYTSNALATSLTILNGDDQSVTYTFDQANQRVTITRGGQNWTALTNCNLLTFSLFARPPGTNGSFGLYPVSMTGTNWYSTVKVVRLKWRTRMTISPTARVTSEDIQTACIVIRKQRES